MHRLGGAHGGDEIVDGGQGGSVAGAELAHGWCPGGRVQADGLGENTGGAEGGSVLKAGD